MVCTECAVGYYALSSSSTCVANCPSGLLDDSECNDTIEVSLCFEFSNKEILLSSHSVNISLPSDPLLHPFAVY